VVFGQVHLSADHPVLTVLYLVGARSIVGVHLPPAHTRRAVTVVVGLLPVLGNLIPHTMIAILSLRVSRAVGIASLAFLVVIHKLEDVLNRTWSAPRCRRTPGSCGPSCLCWRPPSASLA
jgi:hypothetical protein